MKNLHFHSPEEALETLRLATEAASLGVWDLNVESGELHWSELSKGIFGITKPGALSVSDFFDGVHPDERQRVKEAMDAALDPEGSREYDIEYRICRPNQEQRVVHAKGKAFFSEVDGTLRATRFVGTLLDRTDQKLAQAALLQAEQLAVTGRLAASIAHEINNPLEAITNLLYLLRDAVQDRPEADLLQQAESELARVSEIASNTLRFYRDPSEPSSVDVGGLTKSVVNLFHGRMAIRGVELEVSCYPGTHVFTRQGQLRQVLVNLVGNAIDAMPSGGKLKVRCRPYSKEEGNGQAGVRISVADTGVGMEPEVLKRAFDPFFTTKGNAGTGLGLWLSREIVQKHGFHMHVKSRPGHGTAFCLHLPEAAATQPAQ